MSPSAVLDADVLVPVLSCDLLMSAFDHDLYRPVLTPRLLAEVERSLLAVAAIAWSRAPIWR